ncbi:hypothetical protein [Ammoniphilus sp. YIM 78166]|uniref:hypothetical protein n=1 Tax=Ammoniphilus sp. YIM 78166 TaxID=1644106 RepID=UPI00106FF69B|nr:hypothetical protein [Ammoniphilus sp. YIM 78166]
MSKLREKILNAKDIKEENVPVSEWEVEVQVRGLTGSARAKILSACVDTQTGAMDFEKLYPELLIASVYDPETGEKVFADADRDALNGKSGGALEKVAQVAMKLSGFNQAAVKEATKN